MSEDQQGEAFAPLVAAWHRALARGDVEALLLLTRDDVEITGPRGAAWGHQALREWIAQATIQLDPVRWFGRADRVVVEAEARWRSEDGELGAPITVATQFLGNAGRVALLARFDTTSAALSAADLTTADEIIGRGELEEFMPES